MSEYLNDVPEGYEGERCQYDCPGAPRRLCGLPAWADAPEEEARCEFHSEQTPADIRERLAGAVKAGAKLRYADLSGADLLGADLSGADLLGADLSGAWLAEANLSGADLPGADLSGAGFPRAKLRDADLRGATLRPRWLLRSEASAKQEMAGSAQIVDLREADLRGVFLEGVTIAPENDLEGARFGPDSQADPEDTIREESDATRADDFDQCARVYRQLKLVFQDSGNYERAGEFFLREMCCLRQAMVRRGGHLRRRAYWYVFEKTAGYGERPGRVLLWALGAAVFFAFVHGWLGIQDDPGRWAVGPGIGWPGLDGMRAFGTSLYFSVVTFSSLGYGDLQPAPVWGRLCSGIEAVLGVISMSLFLVCVVRKLGR